MDTLINISMYIGTFILGTFLVFASTKIKKVYLTYIGKKGKKISFDKENLIGNIITNSTIVILTLFFLLPSILFSQNLKDLFYLITGSIGLFLLFSLFFINKKPPEYLSKKK